MGIWGYDDEIRSRSAYKVQGFGARQWIMTGPREAMQSLKTISAQIAAKEGQSSCQGSFPKTTNQARMAPTCRYAILIGTVRRVIRHILQPSPCPAVSLCNRTLRLKTSKTGIELRDLRASWCLLRCYNVSHSDTELAPPWILQNSEPCAQNIAYIKLYSNSKVTRLH